MISKRQSKDAILHDRLARAFSAIQRSRFGRWLFGINVVVAAMMAGAVSAGVVLITLVEREVIGSVVAAGVALGVSAITNGVETYRQRPQPGSVPELKNLMKLAYRDVINRSKLCRE